ncbi:type II toxin-antitoxin system RelE/ParE family toxin [Pseudomonas sp. S 311-6]|uniref:type II toxin-antitoxin system RelE/ParE family toxin n=1 Tax=Kerstersia gyiorum TaxID=206506 RepID=UPI002096929C|nr:type II toxin-antitoxin system RelE/ParE family toxin [Pseudomonas sp. S 311-6]
MNTINLTEEFGRWLSSLKDVMGKAKILARLRNASLGNFGDIKPIGDGVSEMRIDFGPGYRVYYAREGRVVYLLLHGGDKSTQQKDIATAIRMWKKIQEEQS